MGVWVSPPSAQVLKSTHVATKADTASSGSGSLAAFDAASIDVANVHHCEIADFGVQVQICALSVVLMYLSA